MTRAILKLTLLLCFLSGCGSSSYYLRDSTNVSKEKKAYDKLLIVSRSKDRVARLRSENKIVEDLEAKGVAAVASIHYITTEKLTGELSDEEVQAIRLDLLDKGYQGAVITNLIRTEDYEEIIRGGASTNFGAVEHGRFGRYYDHHPVSYWEPDKLETGVEYTLEVCLYDLRLELENDLQWIGHFKIRDPDDLMKIIEQFSGELTRELLAQSIVP